MASVGLLVDDPANVVEGDDDDIIRDLLVGMGHTVTLRGPSESAATVVAAHAFLVSAPMSGAGEATLGTRYFDAALPIVVLANTKNTWGDCYRLVGSASTGTNRTWDIYAAAVGDPLAAGYSGSKTVWSGTSSSMTNYFTPSLPTGSLKVANQNGDLTRCTMFEVPAGAPLWNTATSAFDGNTTHGWRGGISAPGVNVVSYRTAVWENLFRALVDEAEANSVAPPPENTKPTASYAITPSQSVALGTLVTATLTGSDTDGTIASYSHSLSVPSGSSATLSSTTAQAPTFTPDVAGSYVVTGTVTDDDGAVSDPVSKTINAATVSPPSGEASVSQTATIDLTGVQGSVGGALTYSVAFVSGDNSVALTETSAGVFTRPTPSITTTYSWTVTEDGGSSLSGTATITVAAGSQLEDLYVLISNDPDPIRWAKVSEPGAPLYDEFGDPVVVP